MKNSSENGLKYTSKSRSEEINPLPESKSSITRPKEIFYNKRKGNKSRTPSEKSESVKRERYERIFSLKIRERSPFHRLEKFQFTSLFYT